jgi:hypothetical protein
LISSEIREELFEKLQHYTRDLSNITAMADPLKWIDGSCITKEPNTNDIDLVTFIPYDIVERLGTGLNLYKYPGSIENYGIDGYILKVYPVNHEQYSMYLGDRAYWMDHFTKSKINRRGNKLPKGFLEIGIDSNKIEYE